tara:strand:- start:367 stop:858 length:492 start_codon:yes stop_codon:yes gene_type:complete
MQKEVSVFKVFLKGLVFGFGVIVAFVIAILVASNFDIPKTFTSQDVKRFESLSSLTEEEKILKSSAIIVLRFKSEKDTLMAAYVAEIYKKSPSIEVQAEVGALRKNDNYYAREHASMNRDGVVVFLTGSPAKEQSKLYLYNNRLAGTTDMPIDIVIKKFNQAK